MTEAQRHLLDRRIRAAAEQQPEILTLRTRLLTIGGVELVPPPKLDADVPTLIVEGSVMTGAVASKLVEEGQCHENVSELWFDNKDGLVGIGVGYALSADGLWREHSWGVGQEKIIETTSERIQYFGRVLRGADADRFAETNRGDPEQRYWRRLPEVYFRLQKDEDGYPPKDWEGLKAEPIDQSGTYRIKSIPFFAREVAYGDEVRAGTSTEGFSPVFDAVVKRSGYSTVRLLISESEDRDALRGHFTNLNCLVEFKDILVAIGIPKDGFDQVSAYIGAEMDSGRWGVEDGYLVTDE